MRKPTIGWNEPARLQDYLIERDRQAKLVEKDKREQDRNHERGRLNEAARKAEWLADATAGKIHITLNDVLGVRDAQ